jgi:glycosyltransferase involved in cell wall biosynthesis
MKGDSGLHAPRSLFKRALKRLLYRFLLPRFDGHLYIGQENRAYLQHYGVSTGQLFFSPLCVDGHWFAKTAAEAEESNAPARLRAEIGIDPQSFVFLFVGKFIAIKQPDRFLRAFLKLRALHPAAKIDAVLVGQGPMQSRLEAIGASCPGRIHFAGFKNQTQLPAYYRLADCLVLPGHDSWGLVVNEAAACGVPALVSDGVGCARDLIAPGETGFVFRHDDIDDMVHCMAEMRRCVEENPKGIARCLSRKCQEYGQEAATRGLQAALAHVVGARSGTGNAARSSSDRVSIPADEGSPRRQRKAC